MDRIGQATRQILTWSLGLLIAATCAAGQVELLSGADPSLFAGMGGEESFFPPLRGSRVSADGRYVVFESLARNLAPGQIDANGTWDVFLHDRWTGETWLASGTADLTRRTGNDASGRSSLSADGRFVLFTSLAGDLVPGLSGPPRTIRAFLFDRVSGTTVLVGPTNAAPERACCFNEFAEPPRISADGRFVVFHSDSPAVIPGQIDMNGLSDVFLFDRETGMTALVSHVPGLPTIAAGAPGPASISGDGRFITYGSLILYDRLTDERTSLSIAGGGEISEDGSAVVVVSFYPYPGYNDSNGVEDVFVYDRASATLSLVSRKSGTTTTGNGRSSAPTISADGRRIAFLSQATDLVPGQTDLNGDRDVFVHDRDTGTTILASRAAGFSTRTGNGRSGSARISADGGSVAFESLATDLVPLGGDTNGNAEDVFLFDRLAGTTLLASGTGFAGTITGNGRSRWPAVSADGGIVAFESEADNLVLGQRDLNATQDVFAFDRAAGLRSGVSLRAPDLPCLTAAGESLPEALSADGRYVAFTSYAINLVPEQGDANHDTDVFLRDRLTGAARLVSHIAQFPGDPPSANAGNGSSHSPVLSANGRYLVFVSSASILIPGQEDTAFSDDIFLYDRLIEETILLSHSISGTTKAANGSSYSPAISANGRYVTFLSQATDLVSGEGGPNFHTQIFLYDRASGTTKLVSHANGFPATSSNGDAFEPVISANGRAIVFSSEATDLVAGVSDANERADVFLYEVASGKLSLLTRSASVPGSTADGLSGLVAIAGDGRSVAFLSSATDLVPGQAQGGSEFDFNVFLADAGSGTTVLVSHAAASPLRTGNGGTDSSPSLSGDGRYLVFESSASDLIAGQTEPAGLPDVFLYDRSSGSMVRVSASASTQQPANSYSFDPVISENGRTVAFLSLATDLVPGQIDTNPGTDAFVYDRTTEEITLASRAGLPAVAGNGSSHGLLVSGDGSTVAFASIATNLVPSDFNGRTDAFLYTLGEKPK